MSSFLKLWNFHPLDTKGHCSCKQMGGNTFVTVSTEEDGLPRPAFVLQVDDNKNFTVSLNSNLPQNQNASTVALGKWTCCGDKWVGVAISIFQNANPTLIYRRITIEVDTDTLVARFRTVYTDVPVGECVTSFAGEHTLVDSIDTMQLQPLGQNCGLDFELETTAS